MFFGHYFVFHGSNYNELTNKTRYTFLKNKFMYKHFNKKCSYSEIKHLLTIYQGVHITYFIPPANGVSQGNYFQQNREYSDIHSVKFASSLLSSLAGG